MNKKILKLKKIGSFVLFLKHKGKTVYSLYKDKRDAYIKRKKVFSYLEHLEYMELEINKKFKD